MKPMRMIVCVRAQRKMKLSCLPRFEGKKKLRRRPQWKSVHDIFSELQVFNRQLRVERVVTNSHFQLLSQILATLLVPQRTTSLMALLFNWWVDESLRLRFLSDLSKRCSPWLDDSLPDVMKSQVLYGNGTSAAKLSLKVSFFVVYSNTVGLKNSFVWFFAGRAMEVLQMELQFPSRLLLNTLFYWRNNRV